MRDISLAAALLVAGTTAAAEPRFVNRAPELGISHEYSGGWEHFVGGGVATFDCNNDGLPEVFAAGGSAPSLLLINATEQAGADLRFAPWPVPALQAPGITGAYPLEIDGDGVTDLVVLRVGENKLFKGLGNCAFEDASAAWRFDGLDQWTTAFSATWESAARLPTLAFGNYVDRNDPDGPFFACDDNHLYRPVGQHYGAPQALSPGYCALSMLFSDWGRKGAQDLRISNDRHYFVRGGSEQLWRLSPHLSRYGESDGWQHLSIWGMGIASRDLTGDGVPEVFLTSMGDQKLRRLAVNRQTPTYGDAAYETGTTAHVPYAGNEGRPSTGWHAAFGDVDNDGLDDLFIAKGNVNQMPDAAMRDPNNLLMQRTPGKFEEHGNRAGIASPERGRGAALVDLNADGLLDLVVNNRRAPLELYQNVSETEGAWVAIRPRQPAPNTDAIGAWIELTDGTRTWHREITAGGGHAGGVLGYQHFGTGAGNRLRFRVIWPGGPTSTWHKILPGQHVEIKRGAGPYTAMMPVQ